MSPSDLNAHLWAIVNAAGWYWWSLPIVLSMWILLQLYRLNAAVTWIGRVARASVTVACVMMFGAPWFNVAGALAFPLALFAFAVMITQQANLCAKARSRIVRIHLKPIGAVSNVALRVARAAVSPAPYRGVDGPQVDARAGD